LIENRDNFRDILATSALHRDRLCLYRTVLCPPQPGSVHDSAQPGADRCITFLVFLYFARLIIPNRTVIPYLYPIPAFGLTISSLFSAELALSSAWFSASWQGMACRNSLDLTLFYTLSSLVGILVLGKGLRIGSFFWAGIAIGAAGSALILAYRLPDPLTDLVGLTTLIGAAFFNGVASASLTLILQFLFAQLLGLATALQLLEISRPDHPLQQLLLRSAPGSYQHSLQVAVLAEQAAENIGATSSWCAWGQSTMTLENRSTHPSLSKIRFPAS
jgi:cyclic-di-AMP phosphodiesterase PgpH